MVGVRGNAHAERVPPPVPSAPLVSAAPLVPTARRVSRTLVATVLVSSALLDRAGAGTLGARAQQGLVLGALALGMPHGAADTELLRSAAAGDRRRHAALVGGYALLATGATAVVARGGPVVERAVLLASAAHFSEGELACWRAAPPGRRRLRTALRLLAAGVTTVGLPAAVGTGNRRPAEVGVSGALDHAPTSPAGNKWTVGREDVCRDDAGGGDAGGGDADRAPMQSPARGAGERTGLALLRDPASRHAVAPLTGMAAVAVLALTATGDREAASDTALLTALDLLAPPSTAFAAYFGGWHALRHTARVVDALVAQGQLPPQRSLPGAVATLGRRSAWAAGVGLVAAGVLAARDPKHASDNAFAAVLGLTVPHMTTVALELSRRGAA